MSEAIDILAPQDGAIERESREILKAYGLRLQIAARLAELRNDITPVIEARSAIPPFVREKLGVEVYPSAGKGKCSCGRIISGRKIRCLACYLDFMERQANQQEARVQ